MTLVWAILMAIFAMGFSTTTGNVYLTGLAIAGYTYGALLGAFLLGKLVPRAAEPDAPWYRAVREDPRGQPPLPRSGWYPSV